jgi:glutamate racemase
MEGFFVPNQKDILCHCDEEMFPYSEKQQKKIKKFVHPQEIQTHHKTLSSPKPP